MTGMCYLQPDSVSLIGSVNRMSLMEDRATRVYAEHSRNASRFASTPRVRGQSKGGSQQTRMDAGRTLRQTGDLEKLPGRRGTRCQKCVPGIPLKARKGTQNQDFRSGLRPLKHVFRVLMMRAEFVIQIDKTQVWKPQIRRGHFLTPKPEIRMVPRSFVGLMKRQSQFSTPKFPREYPVF